MEAWLQRATGLTGLIFSLCSGKFGWDAMEWMTSSGTRFSRTTSGPSTSSERVSVCASFKPCGVFMVQDFSWQVPPFHLC